MARKLRLEYAGACYHVINRGNYRRNLFAERGSGEAFEGCVFETCERFGWRLHAYVVMRNHFHLAVETTEPNLSLGMKWLQGTWAMRFNRFRKENGRPFQGRYKALHVEPGHALAQVCHYIHLNPVRAKVVTADRIGEYLRSSLCAFPRKGRPGCLEPRTVLRESGGLADTSAGWRKYREYLAVLAEEELKLREERFGRLSKGWMIGSNDFRLALKQDLAAVAGSLGQAELLGAHAVKEWREDQWAETLQTAARCLKVDLKKLPVRKSDPQKVRLAAVMKLATSVSNGWLAERLMMGQPASVSQFVRRFRLAKKDAEPDFQAVLSKVKT
ncbi:MAG TPA: transposase [Opitutaceae bacterium]